MINEIELLNFKKHKTFKEKIDSKIIVLSGNNGIGKTSILEAISVFSPGKGIFSLDLNECINFNEKFFKISLKSNFNFEFLFQDNKKTVNINNSASPITKLLEYVKIFGITPYLSLAFWKDNTVKRKYIDRIIMQNEPIYASHFARYTDFIKERNNKIEQKIFDHRWADILEPEIIKHGIEITKIRKKVLEKLIKNQNEQIEKYLQSTLKINMYPNFEDQMEIFSKKLDINFIGPHKTKFEIETDIKDSFASTGQHKKALLAITFLAILSAKSEESENILLLDDLFSTLDSNSVKETLNIIETLPMQTWITHLDKIQHNSIANIKL